MAQILINLMIPQSLQYLFEHEYRNIPANICTHQVDPIQQYYWEILGNSWYIKLINNIT